MARFVDECNHSRVHANIDVSHLVPADTSPIDLAKLKGKAIHVHISDCDGKVHRGPTPWPRHHQIRPHLQAIKELDINGTVSIQLEYSPDPAHIVEWVEEAYRETARLMDLSGLRG